MINLKYFDPNLLKADKKHYKGINIYYILYITIKKIDDRENIYGVNPLYLLVNHASAYIEDKNRNKYLISNDSADEKKALLKKYADVWNGIKNEIEDINGGEENNYKKDYMKIKLNPDDDLPLNKPLKFHKWLIIRSVFEEGAKLYPQFFLDDSLYESLNCCNIKKLMFQKELTLIKQLLQKNACFGIIGMLKMLDLDLNLMFVINITTFWWLLMN